MRKKARAVGVLSALIVVAWLVIHGRVVAQSMTPWQWQQQEVNDFFKGALEVRTNGWGRLNARVMNVVMKLVTYSGMVFRVVPAETGAAGEAHNGGWILLDLSIVVNPDKHVEFWLAHEWGHEALGHAASYVHPFGRPWKFVAASTSNEDEADEYAGRFLCKAGYPLPPVVSMLLSLPSPPPGDTHSDGPTRARTVSNAYARAGCASDSDDASDSNTTSRAERRMCREPCQHVVHPAGDLSVCNHAAHPPGDSAPCQHPCMTPYGGWVACHPFDLVPCTHPLHPLGDVSQCVHRLHAQGDMVECE